jgi:maleamate amidohydrolase
MHFLENEWQRFFTDQDKVHHSLRAKREPAGFGNNPALVLIDIYYSVLGFERQPIFESMRKWPSSTGLEGWAAVDQTAIVLAKARELGIPVIHVKGVTPSVNTWKNKKKWRKAAEIPSSEEEMFRSSQIVDEVKPIPGELVIEKGAASAFQGTTLVFQLNSLGIDTVLCCGETTSGCVRASVVDGATYRYKMGVIADCVFDRTEASHYMNLYDLNQKYADVVTRDTATAYFEKIAAERMSPIMT